MDTPTPTALHGIRILDFSRVLAGPFCTMLLADLGADVIKIESPHTGDDTRQWGPPWAGDTDPQSAYFLSVNRNKRSLTLNLKTQEGQKVARELATNSQIVVENFKPRQMAKFNLAYPDLAALNPALVYASITGFGQTGLYSERPGYDFVIQGMSGLMSITGPEDGAPYKVGVALADVIAGLFAATSILGALHHATATGQGQYIDVALLDTQIAAMVNIASNYLISQQVPARYGNAHANIVPYQAFVAADGEFTVAVGNDRQFADLCHIIGRADLATDPRFATNPARVKHRNALLPQLQAAFLTRPVHAWVDALLQKGIPSGAINDVATALTDPHVLARNLIQQVTLSNGATVPLVANPVPMSATPAEIRTPPPRLGEHTDAILQEIGFDAATIRDYRAHGII